MKEVLVVEDNPEMKILIEATLEEFLLTFSASVKDAIQQIQKKKFDLILLDLGLPDGDGMKVLVESTSSAGFQTPIIILSARNETMVKVMAFSVGAEDFISKPFDPLELKARVAAKLKKSESQQNQRDFIKLADLQLNLPKQQAIVLKKSGSSILDLTSLEFKLLLCFVRSPERVFSREYLLDNIWGNEVSVTERTVDTHVGHLRKKISGSKVKIETVVGEGYRLISET